MLFSYMETIKCISSTLIQASNPKNPNYQKIDLTPWDLQLLPYGPIQKGLLFPIPNNQEKSQKIQHLKSSLSRTLNFFPPLSGRLAVEHGRSNDTTCFYIDCNNKGALFIHAVADKITISDIIEPKYVPIIVHSFFPLNGIKNIEGTSNPVLAIQVTELVNGVFIGCTINHTICDGKSFWLFLNSWSEISRAGNSSDALSKPPTLQRWFPENFNCPILIPNWFIKQIHDLNVMMTPRPMVDRVLHFSKEKIGKLKAKVNAEALTKHINTISSLQAVLANIWVSVISVTQNLDLDDEINYRLPVGARGRVDESVCEEYFGNAVQGGIVVTKVKDLLEQGGMGNAALQMNKMVAAHDEGEMRKFFESWARSPRLIRGSDRARSVMSTSCSPRFDVYGNDFGWGKPIAARSGMSNKGPGLLTVYCGVEEGSIDVEVCLLPGVWEALANNEDFMAEIDE